MWNVSLFWVGPRAGRSRFRILAGAEGVLFAPTLPDQPWGPPSLLYNGYLLSLPGIKRSGSEVYHSPPSNTDVKNAWSYTSSASICLHVDRDGFIFTSNLHLPLSLSGRYTSHIFACSSVYPWAYTRYLHWIPAVSTGSRSPHSKQFLTPLAAQLLLRRTNCIHNWSDVAARLWIQGYTAAGLIMRPRDRVPSRLV
jgi:hypothetical protein